MSNKQVAAITWKTYDEIGCVIVRDVITDKVLIESFPSYNRNAIEEINDTLKRFIEGGWTLQAVQPVLIGGDLEQDHYPFYYLERTVEEETKPKAKTRRKVKAKGNEQQFVTN